MPDFPSKINECLDNLTRSEKRQQSILWSIPIPLLFVPVRALRGINS